MSLSQVALLAMFMINGATWAQETVVSFATEPDPVVDSVILDAAGITRRILLLSQVVEGPEAIAAGQDLVRHFESIPVPADVSRVAGNVMIQTPSAKLRLLMATLFAAGPELLDVRAEKMLKVIAIWPRDFKLNSLCVEMFAPDHLQEFVVRYAANPGLPTGVRDLGIRRLGDAKAPGQSLSDEAHAALLAAAMAPGINDKQVDRTLEVWGKSPLTDTYRSRSDARFKIWLTVWLIAVFLLGPAAFFTVLHLATKAGQGSTAWTVFSFFFFVVGAFFIFALYGFGMSHGSGISSDADAITFRVPFVYLAIAIIWGYAISKVKRP